MTKRIPLSVPVLGGNELRYLEECIRTNWVSYAGPMVTRFEEAFAREIGIAQAVAVNSGTAALHLALLAAGVGPGDLVVLPDLTFIAPANAATYVGARCAFVDVTADTWQLDVDKVAAFLSKECVASGSELRDKAGHRVRALLPVHVLGHPVDMDPLRELARRYELLLIEDATESLGATYKGTPTGRLGHAGCFSFNGNKIITSGGGGMVATGDAQVAARMRHLSTQARSLAGEYTHDAVGYNYRLTSLQAAVGLAQLERLGAHVARKRAIAARYRAGLADVPGVTLPVEAPWAHATFWLYTILVDRPARRTSRELIADLAKDDIEARPLWAPIHEQAPYRDAQAFRIERAPELHARAVSLPSSVDLAAEDQDRVIAEVKRSLCAA